MVDYNVEYSVLNDTDLTIGERDAILIDIQRELLNFVSKKTEDNLINRKLELDAKNEKLEQQYSNDKISINILSYQAHD